jgi:hypothetical protein
MADEPQQPRLQPIFTPRPHIWKGVDLQFRPEEELQIIESYSWKRLNISLNAVPIRNLSTRTSE